MTQNLPENNESIQPLLKTAVEDCMLTYYEHLDGHEVTGVYKMVISEVERSLLLSVLKHNAGNQSKAAKQLSISRSTLRKKIQEYQIDA